MFYERMIAERNEGFDRGMAQGSRDTRLQTARRALERGFSVDVAAELTGLTLEEVAELK